MSGEVEVTVLTGKFTFNPKEGIDNPVMVITDDGESVKPSGPRLCVLTKEEGQSYGFHLRVERGRQGHIIKNVVSLGSADRGGLQNGDRLLEVNNCFVDDVPHPEVSRKIKLSGPQLCVLVLDGEAYEKAVLQGEDLRDLVKTYKYGDYKPPRLCHITRNLVSGLGISFTPVEGEKGRFSVSLVIGGAAEKAGVLKGDRLVWMNGAPVSELSPSALNRMLKTCGNHITVLVIDSESEKKYIQHGIPILPSMAASHNLPFKARKVHLVSGPEGYGFVLRLEKTYSGLKYHVLHIDKGSPAGLAGLQDGELLLEINGETVQTLTHEEVLAQVKQEGHQICLTTITSRGLEFYTKLGLSPLLFCDNIAERIEPVLEAEQSSKEVADQIKVCALHKGPLGFGFNLGCFPHSPGIFITQVVVGGPGQNAGLVMGDVVVEVNGQNVEGNCLEDVIMLMKQGGHFLSLSVMEKTSYENMKQTVRPTRDIPKHEDDDQEITYL
ncbi:NHERF family PDZ scaffold protein 4b isoform X2 [Cynoglossus semilaevis]|uniref:NHERF family PDZ scaffold protein 4b isoform X2 n=1 Tax=Cynoglossus semilaevis TaxID=244447 RepID=UPI000497B1B5|nr:Na(+)/H(+) exchange regulatory cofactor NHE-RF4-like isoform X2 [Cynoglossus semilaevis]